MRAPNLSFSRRSFLVSLGSLLLACRQGNGSTAATPTAPVNSVPATTSRHGRPQRSTRAGLRPVIRVALPETSSRTIEWMARLWIARLKGLLPPHWDVRIVSPPESQFRLVVHPGSVDGPVVGIRRFIPATTHDNLLRNIGPDALSALLEGTVADWSQVGAPEQLPIHRVSLSDDGKTLPAPHQVVARISDLPPAWPPGLFVCVEPTALMPRLKVLRIGELDPLQPGDPASFPPVLTESLVIEGPVTVLPGEALEPVALQPTPLNTVTFVGDIILGRTVHRIMTTTGDWSAPFRAVAAELREADLTIGNLECALSDRFPPPADPYTLRFLTATRAIEGLLLAGIDAVSLANNHSIDFGWSAMQDTQAVLATAGIRYFGAGESLQHAIRPAILDLGHQRLALLGFDGIAASWYGATETTPGTAPLDPTIVEEAVNLAKGQADLVIPFFHWGIEYTLVPTDEQRRLARRAIDAGATLVIGSHPHWVQGVEWYRDRPIFYSLGNFVFDQEWSAETKQGLILRLWFRGTRLVRYEFRPVVIEQYHRPRPASETEAAVILERVRRSSAHLATEPID